MIAQNTVKDSLNDRQEKFCQLKAESNISDTQAYIDAGYQSKSPGVHAGQIVKNSKIKNRIREIKVDLAVKHGITQETQCKKLEDLRLRCKAEGDSTGENAAIREQNKLYGLSVDKSVVEQTEAQKLRTATERQEAKDFAQWQLERRLARPEAKKAVNEVYIGLDDGLTAQEVYDRHKDD